MSEKTGPELIEEVAQFPTLDGFLDRDPHAVPYTDEELLRQVEAERLARAQFNIKAEKKSAKKQGVEDVPNPDEDTAG